ncbi:phage head-tail joining protein [Aureimonas glaciei]|uniref:Uncharacterized protein n=1 Tax=Aureimonas glaciei TaxID=1776957 RepID=A0A916XUM0_9HYPH|nr:hypothetical protein GCM10011335_13710 [Aureimonas glaciei]
MASLPDLIKWRDELFQARLSAVREVRDSSGETVRFGSDREMANAIAAADRAIAEGQAGRASRIIRFSTSKGI